MSKSGSVSGHGFSRAVKSIGDAASAAEGDGILRITGSNPRIWIWSGATKTLLLLALLTAPLIAQESEGNKVPSVTMVPAGAVSLRRGALGTAELHFRIGNGFHVNSNTPTEDYLIPTALQLDAPTDIIIGRITYPAGEQRSFPFAPDQKLSVYSGEFSLSIAMRVLSSVVPGSYAVRGQLKYQACDNAACYPPKRLPVAFDVKVVKAPPPPRKNPGQSPHVHS